MKLRFLALAVIAAFCVMGVANAQPQPKLTFGDGNYVDPFANVRVWTGIVYKDKDASGATDKNGKAEADYDLYNGFTGGGTELGAKIKMGKMYVEGSMVTKFARADIDSDISPSLGIAAFYTTDSGIRFGWGNGADSDLQYKGDCAPLDTVADSGMRGYAEGGFTGMRISASYQGAFIAIFSKGYSTNAMSLDSSADTAGVDYVIPRMVIGYKMPGPIGIGGAFLFQSKKLQKNAEVDYDGDGTATAYDTYGKSIVSYAISLNADINMAPMTIHGHFFYNQNDGDMAGNPGPNIAYINAAGDGINNTVTYGGNAAFAYQMGDLRPTAGFGYTTTPKRDDTTDTKAAFSYEVFASLAINMAPGCTFYPGINYSNGKDGLGEKTGATVNAGIFFEEMM